MRARATDPHQGCTPARGSRARQEHQGLAAWQAAGLAPFSSQVRSPPPPLPRATDRARSPLRYTRAAVAGHPPPTSTGGGERPSASTVAAEPGQPDAAAGARRESRCARIASRFPDRAAPLCEHDDWEPLLVGGVSRAADTGRGDAARLRRTPPVHHALAPPQLFDTPLELSAGQLQAAGRRRGRVLMAVAASRRGAPAARVRRVVRHGRFKAAVDAGAADP